MLPRIYNNFTHKYHFDFDVGFEMFMATLLGFKLHGILAWW
jgi:hypothetical protein